LRVLPHLSFRVPSVLGPNRHVPTRKRPTEEIANYMGKVTLVSNLSCLFSAGTIYIYIENIYCFKEKLHLSTWKKLHLKKNPGKNSAWI